MNEKNNEIILFETHDQEVKLSVSLENETVWLSSNQMALLFDRDDVPDFMSCHATDFFACR